MLDTTASLPFKFGITIVQMIFKNLNKQPVCKVRYIHSYILSCISVKFQSEMVVLKVLQDFAGVTSIHGFCYLVSPKSSSWTKIIWAISIFVAMMYATLEMSNSVIGKYHYIFPIM